MPIARGQIEGLGTTPHLILSEDAGSTLEDRPIPKDGPHPHEAALEHILETLRTHFPSLQVKAVGHRIVHGGPRYAEPLVLTAELIADLEKLIPLAPLHQPHNLSVSPPRTAPSRTRCKSAASTPRFIAPTLG